MPLRPRSEIEKLVPAVHGSPDFAEMKSLGIMPEKVIDFSVCHNPYMPPLDIKQIIDGITVSRHPDSEATALREALAGKLSLSPDNILAGNGSMELIRLIALTYFGHGDSVLVMEPTFGEYKVACQISGADIFSMWAEEKAGFAHDIGKAVELIKHGRPKGIFICNPNNPTGRYLSRKEIETVLDASPETLLVIDEAYIAFVENSWPTLELLDRQNLVIVRSMTKDYALAGLRLGYAVAHKSIIETLHRAYQPWNVNSIAQLAGIEALKQDKDLARSLKETGEAKQFLVSEFERLGFAPLPSTTHFFLVKVGNAAAFRSSLLSHGILVRDCASFGLQDYIRIAALTLLDCEKLVNATKKISR